MFFSVCWYWVNWFNDGTGFWDCNFIYEYFEMVMDDEWMSWMVICELRFAMTVVEWGGFRGRLYSFPI